jgi:hypothetical protein
MFLGGGGAEMGQRGRRVSVLADTAGCHKGANHRICEAVVQPDIEALSQGQDFVGLQ